MCQPTPQRILSAIELFKQLFDGRVINRAAFAINL
jgi:hypothetical protein